MLGQDATRYPHTLILYVHILQDYTVHNHTCQQHNIYSLRTQWEGPIQVMTFLRGLARYLEELQQQQ